MNRLLALLLLFPLAACASATPTRSPEARAKQEIQAEYDRLAAAFGRADIPAILSFRTPDFATVGPDGGRTDYAGMAEYTRNWFQLNKPPIETRFTVESLEMHGNDEAAVHVLQWASRRQDRNGKLVTVTHEVRQRETWVRTPQGWKIRMVDQIDLANRKRWIDGVLEGKQ